MLFEDVLMKIRVTRIRSDFAEDIDELLKTMTDSPTSACFAVMMTRSIWEGH